MILMTQEEFEILTTTTAQELISKNIETDPLKFAFGQNSASIPTRLISTQLKYLQKAKSKLPSYFVAKCIIPPLSYEQSSSEATAALKKYKGKSCLDLTCGLGVDSLYFSKNFDKVTSLEMSSVLAAIARHNFTLLKAHNIEVVNKRAEDFIANYKGEKFDLVFVDPARRDDSKNRVFLFEDCSPNLYEILPLIEKISKKLVVKASPLFDNAEAWKKFPHMNHLSVVSVDNECKELLLEFDFEPNEIQSNQIHINRKGQEFYFEFGKEATKAVSHKLAAQFLLEPDVAFYKSRLCGEFFFKYYPNLKIDFNSQDAYFFTETLSENFPGRIFKIKEIIDYQPKTLKKLLKEKGIKQANISKRDFPLTVDDIRKTLQIETGGNLYLFFTKDQQQLKVVIAEKQ